MTTPLPNAPGSHSSHDEIARRARIIWEEAGRTEGQALEHWLLAEAQLRQLPAASSHE